MPKNIFTTGTDRGFTLVELLVAVFLFALIMTISGAVFIYGLDLQRRAYNIQQTEENATFVLETMLKEIRVSDITSPSTSGACAQSLTISHPVLGNITYTFLNPDIKRAVDAGSPANLNSNTVLFSRFDFCVRGVELGDDRQPLVTLVASLKSKKTKQQSTIDIQTSISPRFVND